MQNKINNINWFKLAYGENHISFSYKGWDLSADLDIEENEVSKWFHTAISPDKKEFTPKLSPYEDPKLALMLWVDAGANHIPYHSINMTGGNLEINDLKKIIEKLKTIGPILNENAEKEIKKIFNEE